MKKLKDLTEKWRAQMDGRYGDDADRLMVEALEETAREAFRAGRKAMVSGVEKVHDEFFGQNPNNPG